MNFVFMGNCIN